MKTILKRKSTQSTQRFIVTRKSKVLEELEAKLKLLTELEAKAATDPPREVEIKAGDNIRVEKKDKGNKRTYTISAIQTVVAVGGGGESGAAAWGEITGTLSNQTDLQVALNAKLNTSDFNLSTFSTTNLAEGSNLYFTEERVDDRVANLLDAGNGITLSYDDTLNVLVIEANPSEIFHNSLGGLDGGELGAYYHLTLAQHGGLVSGLDTALHFHSTDRDRANHTGTQTASTISDFNEAAQDAIGLMLDTTLIYVDATPLLTRAEITGDISIPQASNAATLATVNSNVGTFGTASAVGTFTVNAKGLITAASSTPIQIAESQVTSLVSDLAAKQPLDATLTSLAAIAGVQGDIIYASGTDAWTRLAKDATATRYLSNTGTSNNPAWAQINLTNGVTGTLPIANGGTNNTSAYTAGSVIFSDGTSLTQDNANFFWDDVNNRLGIGGVTSPLAKIHITSATGAGIILQRENSIVTSGNVIGGVQWRTTDSDVVTDPIGASIQAIATGNYSTNAAPMRLVFATQTTTAGAAVAEVMRLGPGGGVGIGVSADPTAVLEVSGTSAVAALVFNSAVANASATATTALMRNLATFTGSGTNATLRGFDIDITDIMNGVNHNVVNPLIIDATINTGGAAQTLNEYRGIRIVDPAKDANTTITTVNLLYIDTPTTGATNNSINVQGGHVILNDSGGAYNVRIEGDNAPNLFFLDGVNDRAGINQASPQARLHVTESSLGSEIFRLETVAGNDDPSARVYQERIVTTQGATNTLMTIPIPASTSVTIYTVITARRTAGSAGTAEDGASYAFYAYYKNVAGVATKVNETTVFTAEDQAGWGATSNGSGSNALIQVNGAANNTVTWHCTTWMYQVSS